MASPSPAEEEQRVKALIQAAITEGLVRYSATLPSSHVLSSFPWLSSGLVALHKAGRPDYGHYVTQAVIKATQQKRENKKQIDKQEQNTQQDQHADGDGDGDGVSHKRPRLSSSSSLSTPSDRFKSAKGAVELIQQTFREDSRIADVTAVAAQGGFINVRLPLSLASQCGLASAPLPALDDAFTFHAIGRFASCFKEKHGTPRQGSVFPLARGSLTLAPAIDASSLCGLDEYSHVWLVFVFHESLAAQAGKSFHQLPAKVKPPRLNGAKLGMFATRSPHRINAIGLSLARLERVSGKTLQLSGIDLIDGTPILDIKPYHPADRLEHFAPPHWMRVLPEASLNVSFTSEAAGQLRAIMSECKLEYYHGYEEMRDCIVQCLRLDPRTQHSKDKHHQGIYGVQIDRIDVCFQIHEPTQKQADNQQTHKDGSTSSTSPSSSDSPSPFLHTAEVFKILYFATDAGRPRMRTAEWFKQIQEERKGNDNMETEDKQHNTTEQEHDNPNPNK